MAGGGRRARPGLRGANFGCVVGTDENRRSARVRKLIAFDDDTFDKLKQLGRDRMATIQELADEAFADLLRKHGIPVDLKDALRKSAALTRKSEKPVPPRKAKS